MCGSAVRQCYGSSVLSVRQGEHSYVSCGLDVVLPAITDNSCRSLAHRRLLVSSLIASADIVVDRRWPARATSQVAMAFYYNAFMHVCNNAFMHGSINVFTGAAVLVGQTHKASSH